MEKDTNAIDIVRQMVTDGQVSQEVAERYFPELKESEGEKTKRLLHTIANKMSQHLRDIFTEEEFQCFDAWSNAWLEKQGEQKPAEWSEIDKANLEDSIYFVKEFRRSNLCDNESRLQNSRTCIEWLASLKDRVLPQPKQEWSEEDRKIIIELIGIFESAVDGGHVSFPYRLIKDYIRVLKSWLKSLKDRVRLQNGYNPYKEVVESIAEMCEKYKLPTSDLSDFFDNVKVKCKEAKEFDTMFPQNTWKPSEGQLECLGYAIEKAEKDWSPLTNNRIYLTLKALKEQLLELRGSKV